MRTWSTVALLALVLGGCPASTEAPLDGGTEVAPAAWRPVLENQEGALLAIWGTSERDVWTVGGSLGNGLESFVLRFDGTKWTRARPGGEASFWWVHGSGASDVWLVGEKGRITHFDGVRFEDKPSGTTATLFGVMALAPDDAWAVGGTPDSATADNDVLLHWDGAAWKREELPEKVGVALFKVWAPAKDDVYVVGDQATIWHKKGATWKREAIGLGKGRLTTVAGCSATEVYAVGGRDLLISNGTSWSRADATLLNDVNGVACGGSGTAATNFGNVVVVGAGSVKLRRVGGTWSSDFGSKPFADLHGAWVDPTGALWGVGGNFNGSVQPGARRSGVVARYGPGTVPSTVAP